MIIDSHAHYAHPNLDKEVPYLSACDGEWRVERAKRDEIISALKENGISCVIEPSIGYSAIENQLSLAEKYGNFFRLAIGVHPTRCIRTKWRLRKNLSSLADRANAVAIGETGLDYHYPRKKQHRLRQKAWFLYQLKLADEMKLPLVLHVRDADKDALSILEKQKSRLHGGVAHCFTGDAKTAEKYIALGFAVGIGGKLLADDETGNRLCDTVKNIPLSSILAETDSPLVLPELEDGVCGKSARKKLCNTSLILCAVIKRIAELRGEEYKTVEDEIYKNTLRVFRLNATENS